MMVSRLTIPRNEPAFLASEGQGELRSGCKNLQAFRYLGEGSTENGEPRVEHLP